MPKYKGLGRIIKVNLFFVVDLNSEDDVELVSPKAVDSITSAARSAYGKMIQSLRS